MCKKRFSQNYSEHCSVGITDLPLPPDYIMDDKRSPRDWVVVMGWPRGKVSYFFALDPHTHPPTFSIVAFFFVIFSSHIGTLFSTSFFFLLFFLVQIFSRPLRSSWFRTGVYMKKDIHCRKLGKWNVKWCFSCVPPPLPPPFTTGDTWKKWKKTVEKVTLFSDGFTYCEIFIFHSVEV